MNCAALIDTLKRERQIHEQLLLAKREEQRMLAIGDADGLTHLVEHVNGLTERIARLEAERVEQTHDTASRLGLMAEGLTLRALARRLPEGIERDELEALGNSLRDLAQEIQVTNQANARMLERSIETLNREISTLADQPESRVYSQGGGKPHKDAPRAGLNLRG